MEQLRRKICKCLKIGKDNKPTCTKCVKTEMCCPSCDGTYTSVCTCRVVPVTCERSHQVKTMPVNVYYAPGSPPSRAVLLGVKAVGVEANLKEMNLMGGDHMKPDYLKLNPQHTVPTLEDNGFAVWESRAILQYLADKYAKDDTLYPKDPQKRAVVNQRLFFDMGTLYQAFSDYYYPVMFGGAPFDATKLEKMHQAFEWLDGFLENHKYVAGDNLTIADLSILSTVSTYDIMKFDIPKYKNVAKWFANAKATAPGYEEANGKNVLAFKAMADHLLAGKV